MHHEGAAMFSDISDTPTCPVCGKHNTTRIHRNRMDRFLSLFLPLRRYRCLQPKCGWEGLRRLS